MVIPFFARRKDPSSSVRARGVKLSEKARVAAEHCRGGVEEKPEQNLSRPSTRMMLQMKKRS